MSERRGPVGRGAFSSGPAIILTPGRKELLRNAHPQNPRLRCNLYVDNHLAITSQTARVLFASGCGHTKPKSKEVVMNGLKRTLGVAALSVPILMAACSEV